LHYKNCPQCDAVNESGPSDQCAACGIYYAKWLKAQLRASSSLADKRSGSADKKFFKDTGRATKKASLASHLSSRWLISEAPVKKHELLVRCVLLAGMAIWGWFLIQTNFRITTGLFSEIGFYSSFMGSVTLVFHEAGHVLFMPFGRFMTVLGGSLFQLLVPAALMFAFVYKYKNAFAAAVACWWLGLSLMDLAPYIYDAKAQALMLVGGGTGREIGGHDWHNLLTWTDLMQQHESIASVVETIGELVMVAALVWAGYLLYKQYKSLS
jgi:hypothetical protein